MMERPTLYYWAEVGPHAGKYTVAIDYDTIHQIGGLLFKSEITAVGMETLLPIVKALYNSLKDNGYMPVSVNGQPNGMGRKLSWNEEQQVLQALKGK